MFAPRTGQVTANYSSGEKKDDEVAHMDHVSPATTEQVLPSSSDDKRRIPIPAELTGLSEAEIHQLEVNLKRKIDLRLLPMCILMYILNYLDRNNIAAARIAGKVPLEDDLGLSGNEYQVCVSILFVGYILMQVPSNLFLNKFGKPAIYLPTVMIVWGVISCATSAVQNYAGLLSVRFFLGFVEAAYFPGVLFFLSAWYTRKELALRTALLYSGSLISGAFSGLIGAGVSSGLDGAKGIPAWYVYIPTTLLNQTLKHLRRWLFIIEGVITIFVAFFSYFILPNFPRTTSWLGEKEKALAIYRLQADVGLDDWTSSSEQTFWHGFKLAFSDVKTYILMILLSGGVSTASVTNFFPSVVETLGYNDDVLTLLLSAPPYILAVILSCANAWHADKTGERYFHITLPFYISIAANILAAATTAPAPRYVAMMLMPSSVYPGYVVALAWIANSLPRPPAKRAAAMAAINAVSNITQIYSSFMYQDFMEPRYIVAFSVNCGTALMSILAATALRFVLVRQNKKLDRGEYVEGAVVGDGTESDDQAARKGFRFLI